MVEISRTHTGQTLASSAQLHTAPGGSLFSPFFPMSDNLLASDSCRRGPPAPHICVAPQPPTRWSFSLGLAPGLPTPSLRASRV